MSDEKDYAPAFWARERKNKYGEMELRVTLTEEFLAWARHRLTVPMDAPPTAKQTVKLLIRRKKDTSDKTKPTHYAMLDTWKPGDHRDYPPTSHARHAPQPAGRGMSVDDEDGIPF